MLSMMQGPFIELLRRQHLDKCMLHYQHITDCILEVAHDRGLETQNLMNADDLQTALSRSSRGDRCLCFPLYNMYIHIELISSQYDMH